MNILTANPTARPITKCVNCGHYTWDDTHCCLHCKKTKNILDKGENISPVTEKDLVDSMPDATTPQDTTVVISSLDLSTLISVKIFSKVVLLLNALDLPSLHWEEKDGNLIVYWTENHIGRPS